MRRGRWKRKNVRRVGPHVCGPPAAGGGRLALPHGNQGRKRAALGVIQARGSRGYSPLLFYPQGVRRISPQGGRDIRSAAKPRTAVQRKAAEPQTAAQSLPLTFPRGTRADTQVGPYKTMAVSCSPVGADLRVRPLERPSRGTMERQRVQEQGPFDDHPGFPPHRTRGSRPKQTRSPARAGRRPTSLVGTSSEDPRPRGGPLHRSAAKRFFSLDRPQPVSLFGAPKREMGGGVHCRTPANSPPNGAPPSNRFQIR